MKLSNSSRRHGSLHTAHTSTQKEATVLSVPSLAMKIWLVDACKFIEMLPKLVGCRGVEVALRFGQIKDLHVPLSDRIRGLFPIPLYEHAETMGKQFDWRAPEPALKLPVLAHRNYCNDALPVTRLEPCRIVQHNVLRCAHISARRQTDLSRDHHL